MEKEKRSSHEISHLYKTTIDSINYEFKHSNERNQLNREYEKTISMLKKELDANLKELFNKIVSAYCQKNDVKEINVRKIANF